MFFSCDITYPHIDQNGISGKSAKNGPTSQKHNFFENGRTRLVYDSLWPQGPPKLQKIGLGWFLQLIRPPRADWQFFLDFFRNFDLGHGSSKTEFLDFRVRKKCSKIYFFKISFIFQKYDTLAPFWYIYFDRTPSGSEITIHWNFIVHFSGLIGLSLFWKPLNCVRNTKIVDFY